MTQDPMVAAVSRGDAIESTHLIDVVIADAGGKLVESHGDCEANIFPRSAIKALQAIPLVESGAADAFGFGDEHLALACSSHNGEPVHVQGAQTMLKQAGLEETCLECGAQLPKRPEDQAALVRGGINVTAVHNNCSGKHAGFAAFATHAGLLVKDYTKIEHPVQQEIASVLSATTGYQHTIDNHGIDGCSIPTYRIPISNLAVAFARLGVGEDNSKTRSDAMFRLRDACMNHPHMVAGTERVCTQLMAALPGRVFAKVGAEGVYTAALPEKGLGISMKARDGNFRAVEVAVSTLVSRFLELEEREYELLQPLINPVLRNWNGIDVGRISIMS